MRLIFSGAVPVANAYPPSSLSAVQLTVMAVVVVGALAVGIGAVYLAARSDEHRSRRERAVLVADRGRMLPVNHVGKIGGSKRSPGPPTLPATSCDADAPGEQRDDAGVADGRVSQAREHGGGDVLDGGSTLGAVTGTRARLASVPPAERGTS